MPDRLLITNVSIAKMDEPDDGYGLMTVSYTHLTLPTNREV